MLQKSAEDRSPSETGDDTQEDRIVNVLVTGFGVSTTFYQTCCQLKNFQAFSRCSNLQPVD